MSVVDEDILEVVENFGQSRDVRFGLSTSTGIASLDIALGGKLPSGAVEVYGEAGVGKTTLLYNILASAQSHGWVSALCPSEYLDIPYMRTLGMDLNSLSLITGNTGEWVLEGALEFMDTHRDRKCVLAIDSATSLRPEDDRDEYGYGNWVAMLSAFLEVLLPVLNDQSCVVLTNQVRVKRSVKPGRFFVDGQVDSAGRKLIDMFSARMELQRQDVKDDRYTMSVELVASVFSRPSSIVYLPVNKGDGVDILLDLVRVAVAYGAIQKRGSWYMRGEHSLGQGEAEAAHLMRVNPALVDAVLDDVRRGA